ncbi:MAG: PEP-CTERM sorting domain-containing protein [Opitutaceae bacterium]|nr:PEP-CTERM sorting domain-containing protein [Opitutaceae bacterium]
MHTKLHLLLVGTACALFPLSSQAQLSFFSGTALPNSGGEILSYYAPANLIASTYSSNVSGNVGHGVRFTTLNANGALTSPTVATVDLSNAFGATGVYNLSSVQVDNQGRDFGVATLIPGTTAGAERGTMPGRAVFFQISTGSILGAVDVGYHPDSVTMTPDGNRLVIANEGEFITTAGVQTPGSISIINLAGVGSANDLATALGNAAITANTVGFTGLDLSGIRINATNPGTIAANDRHLYIEPEYVSATNTKAYVSLQENNAVAVIDLQSGTVEAVRDLGTLTQRIDNSDRDGASAIGTSSPRPSIGVNDTATGMLMPDTIARFEKGGQTYLITANEGDARNDTNEATTDEARVGRLNTIASGYEGAGNMFGTRSVSIVNADTGAVVWDSSNGQDIPGAAFQSFEDYIAANDSTTFGMNQNNAFAFRPVEGGVINNFSEGIFTNATATEANSDTRSDDKGPEPESVAYASIGGRDYLFAAMERQGGIFMFDITDLSEVLFVDYINLVVQGDSAGQVYLSPEYMTFLDASSNPTGKHLLLVGYENPSQLFGGMALIEIAPSAIPEPSAFAMVAGLGALGAAALRRRWRA